VAITITDASATAAVTAAIIIIVIINIMPTEFHNFAFLLIAPFCAPVTPVVVVDIIVIIIIMADIVAISPMLIAVARCIR
jgi:hypothetical protein